MKHIFLKNLILALTVGLALGYTVNGKSEGFSGSGTVVSTNLYYFAAAPVIGQSAHLQNVSATGDTAASALKLYRAASPVTVTASAAAGASVVNAVGGTFTASDVVVIAHKTGATQRLTVASSTASTVTFNETLTSAAADGDSLFEMTLAASLLVGDATKEWMPPNALWNGAFSKPLLVEVTGIGTNTLGLNLVSGVYQTR